MHGSSIARACTIPISKGGYAPQRRARPKPPETLRPDLPAWLDATLARAIAKDPAERFRDVSEFATEMEARPARTSVAPRRAPHLL
jgi:hypothetical protein